MPPKIGGRAAIKASKAAPTAEEKKKQKILNKAKANPAQAAKNKEKSDRKRESRKESGSVKKMG